MDRQRFEDVMTTKQVCTWLPFLNPNTLRYLRHKGEGPASFVVNGRVLYRKSEIERWLAEQEQATTRGGAA
ncbi:helix-turn-helix domain-containing protein [Gordonia polyisoprenivorans]|uniref:helix-turn-helix transcriptional regulator n=1 Tax=Gordonia polyisoprenivorans TaxID=84595 RepID=UPI002234ACC1|nr:helix-turn-helix domain-containing protein [Gordonia polyisoprenivorans]